MKSPMSMLTICSAMLISLAASEQYGFAAAVETVGELKTSGGIRFNDNSLQTSACSGCAELVPIERGGTGSDTASGARTNLGVPGILTTNTFTADQAFQSDVSIGGNITIPASTASTGIIMSGSSTLIHTYGAYCLFAGEDAGNLTMTGSYNTGTGKSALHSNTTGNYNTANGYHALSANTEGYDNTATGAYALQSNSTGYRNSAFGLNTLRLNSTGNYNTAIGDDSLHHNSDGNYNSANGASALHNNTSGYDNTATGVNALYDNTTGFRNSAHGMNALSYNTIGSYNTAGGHRALYYNTTANYNTALGASALVIQSFSNSNTTWDSHNTAVGYSALYANQPTTISNGNHNTAVGSESLRQNTTGNYNTAVGRHALYDNTTGVLHTAVGAYALDNNTTGHHNTAVGVDAGFTNTSGDNNTYIGYYADSTTGNLSNATAIGYMAKVNASDKVVIGNSSVTSIGGYTTWSNYSDRRVKSDIREIGYGLDLIRQLRPVQFRMDNGNGNTDFGFIAQDIEEILGTEYNVLDIDGGEERMLSLRYSQFIAPMVKAMQEQQEMIELLQAQVAELKQMLGK